MACLHILTLERLTYSEALYLGHGLQAHAFCDGIHNSLAHHPTLRQVLETCDRTMLYRWIYLLV